MRSGRLWSWAAAAAFLPCLAFPVTSPDLYWHLSAARRMLETGAVPRADWLSHTRAGAPWVDFEWLSQLALYAAHAAGGLAGVWLLKNALLGAAGVAVWLLLGKASPPRRAAAFALWSAGLLARANGRPEAFSLALFGWLFLILERGRGGAPLLLGLFALWANLHAAFPLGLAAVALYVLAGRLPAAGLAAAAAGTLLQPEGPFLYAALWRHAIEGPLVARFLTEWSPARLSNPWHWPYWALLIWAGLGARELWRSRRRFEAAPAALAALLALAAGRHVRLAGFFAAVAAPLGLRWREARSDSRAACAAAVLLCAGYGVWGARALGGFSSLGGERGMPAAAADFLAREKAALGGLTLYNPWGWGGYLGWRLHPEYKVFQDGRYLFHPFLAEAQEGLESPEAWQAFLDRRGVELALVENTPAFSGAYMPAGRWTLVYRDERALLFRKVSRSGPS